MCLTLLLWSLGGRGRNEGEASAAHACQNTACARLFCRHTQENTPAIRSGCPRHVDGDGRRSKCFHGRPCVKRCMLRHGHGARLGRCGELRACALHASVRADEVGRCLPARAAMEEGACVTASSVSLINPPPSCVGVGATGLRGELVLAGRPSRLRDDAFGALAAY